MAKEIEKRIKLQIDAGKATPAPPVGTILGPLGINLNEFCTRFNEATRDKMGDVIPCEVFIYKDRTFDFELKTPPAGFLLKKIAKIQKGSAKGANQVVATISKADLKTVAETKLADLNAYDIEGAMKILEGTARNMGIAIAGVNDEELAQQAKLAQREEAEREKRDQELAQMEEEAKELAEGIKEEPTEVTEAGATDAETTDGEA